jgi:hypothetical protein
LIEEGAAGFVECQELATQFGEAVVAPVAGAVEVAGTAVSEGARELLETHADAAMARLNQALDKVGEWVEVAGDFVATETPLLVQEIVWYGIAEALFPLLIGAVFLSLGIWALIKTFSSAEEWLALNDKRKDALNNPDKSAMPDIRTDGYTYVTFYQVTRFVFPIVGGIFTFVGAITIMCSAFDVVKPWLAPRLYLIEYFRALAQ